MQIWVEMPKNNNKGKMRIKNLIVFFVINLVLFSSCDNGIFGNKSASKHEYNIYKNDAVLRQINTYRQQKKVDDLLQILSSNKTLYTQESLLALASICDSINVPSLNSYLKNKDKIVRQNAAFAMGEIGANYFQEKLMNAYNNETDDFVKKEILIALGKVGSSRALNFVASISPTDKDELIMQGQGNAFFYFAQNGLISTQMLSKTLTMINNPLISQNAKLSYSYILASDNDFDLSKSYEIIENEIKIATNVYLQINLVSALKHIKTSQSVELLRSILSSDADYRVKVGALEALNSFKYFLVRNDFYNQLLDKNSNISIAASRFFVQNGVNTDASKYFEYSKKITSWQARSNMLMAALKYSADKNKIVNSIISGYKVAENKYEKAALLYALSVDPRQYKFVKEQTFNVTDNVISTAGIKSLYAMRISPNFEDVAKRMKQQNNVDIYAEFKIIFKEAMSNGDDAMIYYASKAINNPDFKIIDVFTNTYFITQAMNSLLLPRDIKVYQELCLSIELYGGDKCKNYIITNPLEIDWDELSSISVKQRVLVKTNKGDFEITLDVNSAPVTVYTFIGLVNSAYYNNTYFYKNIQGKAIVNGGKRGDEWMSMNVPLVQELSAQDFQDGSVAMSQNGDGYQSINWFISTFPELSYQGNYTIFGNITKGLEIVHKLEVGDFIIEIKLI